MLIDALSRLDREDTLRRRTLRAYHEEVLAKVDALPDYQMGPARIILRADVEGVTVA